mmetsp:Transcript_47757/g.121091  ORF Transcript_47757/g.121091 Transcript_47757/m.121091 type:complete len:235 (+) Transcript_47757:45-749(+)
MHDISPHLPVRSLVRDPGSSGTMRLLERTLKLGAWPRPPWLPPAHLGLHHPCTASAAPSPRRPLAEPASSRPRWPSCGRARSRPRTSRRATPRSQHRLSCPARPKPRRPAHAQSSPRRPASSRLWRRPRRRPASRWRPPRRRRPRAQRCPHPPSACRATRAALHRRGSRPYRWHPPPFFARTNHHLSAGPGRPEGSSNHPEAHLLRSLQVACDACAAPEASRKKRNTDWASELP